MSLMGGVACCFLLAPSRVLPAASALLAGADVWSAHKDLIAAVSALGSHCIHDALQCNKLNRYGSRLISA